MRGVFVNFLHAFNRGDAAQLDALFAAEPAFNWYSSGRPGLRVGADAYRRHTLRAYFRSRHAHHDRMQLASFALHGITSDERGLSYANFSFTVSRWADELHGDSVAVPGKGAAYCDGHGSLFVLSLGAPTTGPTA